MENCNKNHSQVYSAKIVSLEDLLCKKDEKQSYIIPEYQRPYAWEGKHWEDLWNDLQRACNKGGEYLFGSVYLNKNNEILDGQQRFVTIYIFLRCIGFRKDELCNIELGGNDREFFEKIKSDENINDNNIKTASQRYLKGCREFLHKKVKGEKDCQKFKYFIQKKVFFIETRIDDSDKTNSIITFITQTDRGKRLSNLEKIKSNLYYASYTLNLDKNSDIETIFGECYKFINILYNRPEKGERMIVEALFGLLLKVRSQDRTKQDEIWELDWMSGEDKITEEINKILSSNTDTSQEKVRNFLLEILDKLKRIKDFLNKYTQTIQGNELFHNELVLNRYTIVAMIEGEFNNMPSEPQLQINPSDEANQWLDKQKLELDIYLKLKDKQFVLTLSNGELLNQKLIERAEFSIFKIDKHPYSMFLDKPTKTAHNYKYKELFLLKGISWKNYRYFLLAYEKFCNPKFDYKKEILDIKDDKEESLKIEREHLFAQNPSEEYWNKIKEGFESKIGYEEWKNQIGNILLLPKTINIKISNATPWEKARYILEDEEYKLNDVIFKSTFDFFTDIYSECSKKQDDIDKIKIVKELCEKRTKELKCFIWYRF